MACGLNGVTGWERPNQVWGRTASTRHPQHRAIKHYLPHAQPVRPRLNSWPLVPAMCSLRLDARAHQEYA